MSLYAKPKEPAPHVAPRGENLGLLANRMLMRCSMDAGGLGAALEPYRRVLKDLAIEFSAYVLEEDELATPAEFLRRAILALDRVQKLPDATIGAWSRRMAEPIAQRPFPRSMAIPPNTELRF